MPDETDPPRKQYGFKEREFKRDERPVSETGAAPTAQELAKMAGPVARSKPVGGAAKAGDPNDVYTALQKNRAAEVKTGQDVIEIQRRKNRRRRDFWLIFIPVELFFAFLAVVGQNNPLQFVCAIAGMVIVGLTLPWVMFQLMNRY